MSPIVLAETIQQAAENLNQLIWSAADSGIKVEVSLKFIGRIDAGDLPTIEVQVYQRLHPRP